MSLNGLSLRCTLCWVVHHQSCCNRLAWCITQQNVAKALTIPDEIICKELLRAFWLAIRLRQMSLDAGAEICGKGELWFGISSNSLKIYLAHQLQHFTFSLSNLKPNFDHVLPEYSYSLKIQEYIPRLLYLNFQQKSLQYKYRLIRWCIHQVLVPEWLSGMTRNHVGFARAGSNPAEHGKRSFYSLSFL